jgi:Na+/H+-dicarboxylate symporter
MCRTTLNVTGDLGAATVVSRGEKDVPELLGDGAQVKAI